MDLSSASFWAALGSIILANVLLSGDNAVVIALAARGLPAHQQRKAVVFGSAAAIVMRIALTLLAVEMLKWPFLKLIGALALAYIGVTLMTGGEEEEGGSKQASGLMQAIRTILVADLVMSLDNVLAVAAAANGNTVLLVLGLGISIPLIVFGSTLLLKVMDRFPVIITVGAGLLGFLSGEMLLTDPAVERYVGHPPHLWINIAGVLGALLVVITGKYLLHRGEASADGAA